MIPHIFINKSFENFETNEYAILDKTPYKPEVLILGTFNPETKDNLPDFFYGRKENWFWYAFRSLCGEKLIETKREETKRTKMLEICKNLKMTFADLIFKLNIEKVNSTKNTVQIKHMKYNLIKDKDLEKLKNYIEWNTENIIQFLNKNNTIKAVYFTRRQNNIWENQCKKIQKNCKNVKFTNIYTPTGQRLKGKPRLKFLLKHWLYNNEPDNRFGKLNQEWLSKHKVNLANFEILNSY
ncbi:MAG: hypothetical protein PHR82_04010 [Endomicrobiaceae bacterium]|nr:hypothetical protein [Endomicrobiaceae bacterium]